MLLIISTLQDIYQQKKYHQLFLIGTMFCFAAVTPIMEIGRTVMETVPVYMKGEKPIIRTGHYIFETPEHDNYVGRLDTTFFQILAK